MVFWRRGGGNKDEGKDDEATLPSSSLTTTSPPPSGSSETPPPSLSKQAALDACADLHGELGLELKTNECRKREKHRFETNRRKRALFFFLRLAFARPCVLSLTRSLLRPKTPPRLSDPPGLLLSLHEPFQALLQGRARHVLGLLPRKERRSRRKSRSRSRTRQDLCAPVLLVVKDESETTRLVFLLKCL